MEGGRKQPALLRSLDCFPGKQEVTEISHMAVHNSWPQLVYALGLANGTIILLKADTGELRCAWLSRSNMVHTKDTRYLWHVACTV